MDDELFFCGRAITSPVKKRDEICVIRFYFVSGLYEWQIRDVIDQIKSLGNVIGIFFILTIIIIGS
jgi:hypothetical protein